MFEKRKKSLYRTNLNAHQTIGVKNVQLTGGSVQSGNSAAGNTWRCFSEESCLGRLIILQYLSLFTQLNRAAEHT